MSSKPSALPKNWPQGTPYLTTPLYSPTLTPTLLSALRTRPKDIPEIPANTPKGPCSHVKITPITLPSHPANGQAGLFAMKDLKPGTFVLQYLGEVHTSTSTSTGAADPHADSDYDLSLDRELGIGVDAAKRGNEARFVNDYRGIADKPNAEFREVWDVKRNERGMGVWVLPEGKAKTGKGKAKGIRKGEEILVSYGRGFWGFRRSEEEGS